MKNQFLSTYPSWVLLLLFSFLLACTNEAPTNTDTGNDGTDPIEEDDNTDIFGDDKGLSISLTESTQPIKDPLCGNFDATLTFAPPPSKTPSSYSFTSWDPENEGSNLADPSLPSSNWRNSGVAGQYINNFTSQTAWTSSQEAYQVNVTVTYTDGTDTTYNDVNVAIGMNPACAQ